MSDSIKRFANKLDFTDLRYATIDEAVAKALELEGLTLMAAERDRGDGRMAHYGDGEQPWDTCLRLGWAAQGAAFSILRYMRRTKQPERDLKHAKVYLGWLYGLAKFNSCETPAADVFRELLRELTADELERLGITEEQLSL